MTDRQNAALATENDFLISHSLQDRDALQSNNAKARLQLPDNALLLTIPMPVSRSLPLPFSPLRELCGIFVRGRPDNPSFEMNSSALSRLRQGPPHMKRDGNRHG